MQFIKYFLPAVAAAVAIPAAAVSLEVQPGNLSALITDDVRLTERLTLTGSMDQRDFDALDLLPSLRELDLSQVTIAAYTPLKVKGMMYATYDADALPPGALLGRHLSAVKLPASLKSIGCGALAGNDFTAIEIPSSVTSIDDAAFYGCTSLESIEIPAGVTRLGDNILAGCTALTGASVGTTSLPRGAFAGCSALQSVTFSPALTEIGPCAFAGCAALKTVALPASLSSIGEKAFALSGLTEISLPASVKSVGDYAFSLCPSLGKASFAATPELGRGLFFYDPALAAVSFADDGAAPSEYPDYLFAGSTQLALPQGLDGVKTLGRYALKDNSAVALSLGSSLEHLDDGALEGMTALTTIDAQGLGTSVPTLGADVFAGIDQPSVTLITAEGEPTDNWLAADQWQEFTISAFTGIHSPGAEADGVKAWFRGQILCVRASRSITSLTVSDASGMTLVSLTPGDTEAEVDMSGFGARVYVVTARTASSSMTFKLTR